MIHQETPRQYSVDPSSSVLLQASGPCRAASVLILSTWLLRIEVSCESRDAISSSGDRSTMKTDNYKKNEKSLDRDCHSWKKECISLWQTSLMMVYDCSACILRVKHAKCFLLKRSTADLFEARIQGWNKERRIILKVCRPPVVGRWDSAQRKASSASWKIHALISKFDSCDCAGKSPFWPISRPIGNRWTPPVLNLTQYRS